MYAVIGLDYFGRQWIIFEMFDNWVGAEAHAEAIRQRNPGWSIYVFIQATTPPTEAAKEQGDDHSAADGGGE